MNFKITIVFGLCTKSADNLQSWSCESEEENINKPIIFIYIFIIYIQLFICFIIQLDAYIYVHKTSIVFN